MLALAPNLTVGGLGLEEAYDAVETWFDGIAGGTKGTPVQSVAELVHMASELSYTGKDGKPARVGDRLKPHDIEMWLHERAKTLGVELVEHRDATDVRGVGAEAAAIFANLGRIPTDVTIGGGADHLTISITGKVTGEAKVGGAKLEGEASSDGVKGSVSSGDTKLSGGYEVGKGATAELDVGLVKVKGTVQPQGDSVSWSAEISIGTLGFVASADDIAKVMLGAQQTFATSGEALLKNPGISGLEEYASPLKKAVSDVVEKAQKSAAQAKPGWSVGVSVKGDASGGVSGAVTLTWVF
jgi:hypothetical protein